MTQAVASLPVGPFQILSDVQRSSSSPSKCGLGRVSMAETIARRFSEKREKSSEKSETEIEFASRMMREVIAPPGLAESKGERVRLAARMLKWGFSRARDVWYADPRVSLKPAELRAIEEVSGFVYGRNEVDELDQIIARADHLLQDAAPDFRRILAGAIREALCAVVGAGTAI